MYLGHLVEEGALEGDLSCPAAPLHGWVAIVHHAAERTVFFVFIQNLLAFIC
jgi:hypothetical protein